MTRWKCCCRCDAVPLVNALQFLPHHPPFRCRSSQTLQSTRTPGWRWSASSCRCRLAQPPPAFSRSLTLAAGFAAVICGVCGAVQRMAAARVFAVQSCVRTRHSRECARRLRRHAGLPQAGASTARCRWRSLSHGVQYFAGGGGTSCAICRACVSGCRPAKRHRSSCKCCLKAGTLSWN